MTFREFVFPRITRRLLIRITAVAIVTFVIFKYMLIPVRIQGISMEPTYHDGGVNLCWRLKYVFRQPARQDVVLVKLAGLRIAYLKRIVAFGGETVEFRKGILYVNGKPLNEPYIVTPCDWNMDQRLVSKNHVYVVGDNRAIEFERAEFGETPMSRIVGGPLW